MLGKIFNKILGFINRIPDTDTIKNITTIMDLELQYPYTEIATGNAHSFNKVMSYSAVDVLRNYKHDFSFYRDIYHPTECKNINNSSIEHARDIFLIWANQQSSFSGDTWTPITTANRLYFISTYYNVFFKNARNDLRALVIGHIITHAKHLNIKSVLCDIDTRLLIARSIILATSPLQNKEAIDMLEIAYSQFLKDVQNVVTTNNISPCTIFLALKFINEISKIKDNNIFNSVIKYLGMLTSVSSCGHNISNFNASNDVSNILPFHKTDILKIISELHFKTFDRQYHFVNILKSTIANNTLIICSGAPNNPAMGSFEYYYNNIPVIINRIGNNVQNHSTVQIDSFMDTKGERSFNEVLANSLISRTKYYSQGLKVGYSRDIIMNPWGIIGRDTIHSKKDVVTIRFYLNKEAKVIKKPYNKIDITIGDYKWEFDAGNLNCYISNDNDGYKIDLNFVSINKSAFWSIYRIN